MEVELGEVAARPRDRDDKVAYYSLTILGGDIGAGCDALLAEERERLGRVTARRRPRRVGEMIVVDQDDDKPEVALLLAIGRGEIHRGVDELRRIERARLERSVNA